jgi:uncharacterized protein YbjT (DUF2867 family)
VTDTILVLAATGKTGRRLLPELAARGTQVRAASRRSGEGLTPFDWDRPETHDPAVTGATAIYLVGPQAVDDPSPVVGPFLEHAARAGVERVVFLSSLGVEFPHEPPESGRHRIEEQVRSSGLAWTILRPSGFNQNFSEDFLLPGIVQADTIATATGRGAVAFIDATDIAAVAAVALTDQRHSGKTYVLTGPQALTFAQTAAIISRAAGRTVTHQPMSSDALHDVLVTAGLPPDLAATVLRDQGAIREGFGARVTDTVAEITGRPPTTFADYAIRAAAAWTRPDAVPVA